LLGSAQEENVSREVTKQCEAESRNGDDDAAGEAITEKPNDPQAGSHDIESLSSGSSIELLLDISDETQDHAVSAVPDDGQNLPVVLDDGDKQYQVQVAEAMDVESTDASLSSSSDHFDSASRLDNSTGGEIENIASSAAADTMAKSETTELSVDVIAVDGDRNNEVTEAEETEIDVELQQVSTLIPSSTDGTIELESYDNVLNETARFVVFSHNARLIVISYY